MDQDYIIRSQSDQVNTKEGIFPVCDKPYHTNKEILQKWKELEIFRNYASISTSVCCRCRFLTMAVFHLFQQQTIVLLI